MVVQKTLSTVRTMQEVRGGPLKSGKRVILLITMLLKRLSIDSKF